jgi:hypothetical protein
MEARLKKGKLSGRDALPVAAGVTVAAKDEDCNPIVGAKYTGLHALRDL